MTVPVHHSIDITGEVCPMTFVRTKLALERMHAGEVLRVRRAPGSARRRSHDSRHRGRRQRSRRDHPARRRHL